MGKNETTQKSTQTEGPKVKPMPPLPTPPPTKLVRGEDTSKNPKTNVTTKD